MCSQYASDADKPETQLLPAGKWLGEYDFLREQLLGEVGPRLEGSSWGLAGAEFELDSHRQHVARLADGASDENLALHARDAPIVIAGLPRTGSTLLQALLDRSTAGHAPRSWELLVRNVSPESFAIERRRAIGEAEARAKLVQELSPRLFGLHPFGAFEPAECTPALAASLLCQQTLYMFNCPAFERRIASSGGEFTYALWREHVRRLYAIRPQRLILKSPMHVGYYHRILEILPSARIIQIRRPAEDVLRSLLNLVEVGRAVFDACCSPSELGAYWLEWMLRTLEIGESEYATFEGNIVSVNYAELRQRPSSLIAKVCNGIAEYDPDPQSLVGVANSMHSFHTSSLRSLEYYGLSSSTVRHELAPYLGGPLVC